MTRKTLLIIVYTYIGIGLLVFFLSSFPFSSSKQKNTQALTVAAPTLFFPPSNVPSTKLWFSPDPAYIDKDGNVTLLVVMDTVENNVTSVKLEIAYDPKVLQLVSIKPDGVLYARTVITNNVDEVNGRITFAGGISTAKGEIPIKTTNEELSRLVFRPINNSVPETVIKLLPESGVTAEGINNSALVGMKDVTVKLTRSTKSKIYEQD